MNLNSLIIEGSLKTGNREGTCFEFVLITNRTTRTTTGGKMNVKASFDVLTYGKLADICEEKFEQGRGIRIVGRLDNRDSKVVIVAEHVEFKENSKKGVKK